MERIILLITAIIPGLSTKTMKTYRARGMEKPGLQTRVALVKFALQEGLIKRD
jgi:DNA-binding CsgD family transcriptional regulator